MKILQVHNYYKSSGGEDIAVKNEYDLLSSGNHKIVQYLKSNNEIENFSYPQKASLFFNTFYSNDSYKEISTLIKKEKPDICHVHNFVPLISPAVYFACKDNSIPVVQTLHNYRIICSNAYLFRAGKVCEECLGGSLYHSVKYGCYRNAKIQTLALARMVEKHKKINTWNEKINAFITPTFFTRNKYIEGGFQEEKFFIKPNFIAEDPGYSKFRQDYFIFSGRLDEIKGVKTLLSASESIQKNIKILIAGERSLKNNLTTDKVYDYAKIEFVGFLNHRNLFDKIKKSIAVIVPSLGYETFSLSIIEAFACGKPVIASNHGAMAELIENGKTGLLFEPGNAEDLANIINWAITHKEEIREMGKNARKEYEEKYTAEKNYEILMNIYNSVISNYKS